TFGEVPRQLLFELLGELLVERLAEEIGIAQGGHGFRFQVSSFRLTFKEPWRAGGVSPRIERRYDMILGILVSPSDPGADTPGSPFSSPPWRSAPGSWP